MEVHHHPDLNHKRKKFFEYFLEFLMIFLAVSMGFIAENIRENISDHAKEKEYIKSFVSNLKDDSAYLANTIQENQDKLRNLDSLMRLSRAHINDTNVRRSLYQYSLRSMGFYSQFKSNDATMLQLTNSGGLRFITHDHIADSIAKYDNEMKAVYSAGNFYTEATTNGVLASQDLLDYSVLYDTSFFLNGVFTGKLLPLLSTENGRLKAFFNKVDLEIGATKNYVSNLRLRLPMALSLSRFLKVKYKLPDE
jgi:hypothetical protein